MCVRSRFGRYFGKSLSLNLGMDQGFIKIRSFELEFGLLPEAVKPKTTTLTQDKMRQSGHIKL